MKTTTTLRERFDAKIAVQDNGCWLWTGSIDPAGYGRIWDGARPARAHRIAFAWANGPIPPGLDLDHLCRNRACCNPAHLEAVTRRVNLLRGDTIVRAHHEDRNCGSPGCKNCRRFAGPETAA